MITIKGGTGNEKVKLQIGELNSVTTKAIRYAYYDIGKDLMIETRRLINEKPKHGRRYIKRLGLKGKRLKNPQKYTASAPGEAPAVVTGELRKSINFTVSGWQSMEFGIDLRYGNAPYAKYLEYKNMIAMQGAGSKKIAPRPFLSGAYNNKKANILEHFKRNIAKSVEK